MVDKAQQAKRLDKITLELVLLGVLDGETAEFLRQCAERLRQQGVKEKINEHRIA